MAMELAKEIPVIKALSLSMGVTQYCLQATRKYLHDVGFFSDRTLAGEFPLHRPTRARQPPNDGIASSISK